MSASAARKREVNAALRARLIPCFRGRRYIERRDLADALRSAIPDVLHPEELAHYDVDALIEECLSAFFAGSGLPN